MDRRLQQAPEGSAQAIGNAARLIGCGDRRTRRTPFRARHSTGRHSDSVSLGQPVGAYLSVLRWATVSRRARRARGRCDATRGDRPRRASRQRNLQHAGRPEPLLVEELLISLSFRGQSSVRPVQVGGFDVNIVIHRSTAVRGRGGPARHDAWPPPWEPSWPTRTGPVEADGAVDAQNAQRFPRASTGLFPSNHPRKTPKGPKIALGNPDRPHIQRSSMSTVSGR